MVVYSTIPFNDECIATLDEPGRYAIRSWIMYGNIQPTKQDIYHL